MGSKFDLPPELQETLIIHAKEFAPVHKKRMNKWLECQFEARQRAEEIKMNKQLEGYKEENIVAIYFLNNITLPVVGKQLPRQEKNTMT